MNLDEFGRRLCDCGHPVDYPFHLNPDEGWGEGGCRYCEDCTATREQLEVTS